MLSFSEQYNISYGIFLAFKNNSNKRQLSVGHSEVVRNKYKYMFPKRFETYTKENFIFTCLYLAFTKSPSSFDSFVEKLKESNMESTILAFKDSIVNYKGYLKEDVEHMRSSYGRATVANMFSEYLKNNIRFYTLWFYLRYLPIEEELSYTNIQQIHINKIKVLLLYVTFSEQSLTSIKSIFLESSLLN